MNIRLGMLVLGVIALLLTETALKAHAQMSAPPLSAGVPDPGGALSSPPAEFKALPLPPAGFDALHATPEDQAKYGVPPAPDPVVAPEAFAEWQKAVAIPLSLPHPFASTPVLQATQMLHPPVKRVDASKPSPDRIIKGSTASDWSGVMIDSFLSGLPPIFTKEAI